MYLPKLSDLPACLVCNDGTPVTDTAVWENKRRKETTTKRTKKQHKFWRKET